MLEYVLWCVEEEKLRKRIDMKKVCVIGHFGFGENLLNGQTIKTKIVTNELDKQFDADQVVKIDTHGGAKALPSVVLQMIKAFRECDNIIIFPAHNGIKIFVPLCKSINRFFHRRLHYVVIGGWLTDFLKKRKNLTKALMSFDGIYVETNTMRKALEIQGFNNVYVMPNFKDLNILKESELVYPNTEPYRLCTFSRVMKEKGIEDAVNAVKTVNKHFGRTVYTLDIYGQVDSAQTDWFNELESTFPSYIKYGGLVPFDKSVEVLKNYFALLFPTYYEGEGFAGTLLDAMAAGVPVVASDWRYNSEIVNEKTGYVYPVHDNYAFIDTLINVRNNLDLLLSKKQDCLKEAEKYKAENVIQCLISKF